MKKVKAVFLASTSLLMAGMALAQELPQGFMQAQPFEYRGKVIGLETWGFKGNDALFIVSPDHKTVIAGYVFDADGRDIGAALSGTPPVDVWESLQLPVPDAAVNPATSPAIEPALAPSAAEPAVAPPTGLMEFPDDLDLDQTGSAVTGSGPVAAQPASGEQTIDPRVLPPGVSYPSIPTTSAADTAAAASSEEDPAVQINKIMDDAKNAMKGMDEKRKRDLLIELVQAMQAAKTPQEFQLAVIGWNEKVQGKRLISDAEKAQIAAAGETSSIPALSDAAPSPSVSLVAPEPVLTSSLPAAPIAALEPAAQGDVIKKGEASKKDGAAFLEEFRKDSFWFSVGNPAAPAVYAIIDPTCPHCAKAISNLQSDVEGGKIHLRVIIAPLLSQEAPDMIAGILLSKDPAKTFWEHELKKARFGSSDLVKQPFSSLAANVNAALKGNYDLVVDNKLPGVPFFGWMEDDGPKFLQGVPEAGRFAKAKVDPYTGTKN